MRLVASHASPVSGAIALTAYITAIEPLLGLQAKQRRLVGVQFRLDGCPLEARVARAPYAITWSAASASNGRHTLTAEAIYSDGTVVASGPLVLTVGNPTTFNRLFYVAAQAGSDSNSGLSASAPWQTIGQANNSVQPGDTVYLKGTFSGVRIFPQASGTAAKPIRFTNWPGFQAVFAAGIWDTNCLLDGLGYIIVDGLTLQDAGSDGVAIRSGAHHITLRNNTILRQRIEVIQASDNVIVGNTIQNVGSEAANAGDSIWVANGASRNKILSNQITNGGHSCIMIGGDGVGDVEVGDNVVAHNVISNRWAMPLTLNWMARRTLVEYNQIQDATQNGVISARYGITIQASSNIIRYNDITNNTGGGIQLAAYTYRDVITQDAIGNQIYNNTIYGNGRCGLQMSIDSGRQVKDNRVVNNILFQNAGFAFEGSHYSIWIDFYHNPTMWPAGSLNGNQIQNNLVLRQPGSAGERAVIIVPPNATKDEFYTIAEFQAAFAEARNNLEVDPLFVKAAAYDFHLQAGSPAMDRGQAIPGISSAGKAPDVGAHEFTAPQRADGSRN